MFRAHKPESERFVRHVREEAGGCIVWTGGRQAQGYGIFMRTDQRTALAHRVAFELDRGPIPAESLLRHRCGNRACVNVDHLELVPRKRDPLLRFAEKVEVSDDGCWRWLAGTFAFGHGAFQEGKNRLAHRWLYELVVEAVPVGLELDHLCRNPACVNPDHLEAVTHAENLRRSPITPLSGRYNAAKKRCKRGHDLALHAHVRIDGRRQCLLCDRERRRAKRVAAGLPVRPEAWKVAG